MAKKVFASALAVSLLVFAACGDDNGTSEAGGGGNASTCVDYSGVSGEASFENDVMGVFALSCNSTSCHGGATPGAGLSLVATSASDRTALIGSLVGNSAQRSGMKLVVAGEPDISWLLVTCEYDKADFEGCGNTTCSAQGCGVRMPMGGDKLTDSQLKVVRQWIKGGAKDN